MKIGIVGGTGDIGEGLALRLSYQHEVILGSRDEDKACAVSSSTIASLQERGLCSMCRGVCNQEAVDEGDLVILAVPYAHVVSTITSLSGFEDKIVISPVNPIARSEYFYYNPPQEGSAALLIKNMLPNTAKLVAAFNNIAANKWKQLDEELNYSVAVCGDDPEAKEVVKNLVNSIQGLCAFDAGPLAMSSIVESITPLLLNIARYNKMKDVGIQFI